MSDLVWVSIICSARVRASSARFCQYSGSSVMFEAITSLHSLPPSVLIKNARSTALIPGVLRNFFALCSNELFLQHLRCDNTANRKQRGCGTLRSVSLGVLGL